jgi:hypothetical protein
VAGTGVVPEMGHSAFDLPGGLGYAPPALDGIAVERASEPVAASLTRET